MKLDMVKITFNGVERRVKVGRLGKLPVSYFEAWAVIAIENAIPAMMAKFKERHYCDWCPKIKINPERWDQHKEKLFWAELEAKAKFKF